MSKRKTRSQDRSPDTVIRKLRIIDSDKPRRCQIYLKERLTQRDTCESLRCKIM